MHRFVAHPRSNIGAAGVALIFVRRRHHVGGDHVAIVIRTLPGRAMVRQLVRPDRQSYASAAGHAAAKAPHMLLA